MPTLSPFASLALRLLGMLDVACPAAVLGRLLNVEEEVLPALLHGLHAKALVEECPENRYRACRSKTDTWRVETQVGRDVKLLSTLDAQAFRFGTMPDALRLHDNGNFPDFLSSGLACLRGFIQTEQVEAARCAYAVLAYLLRRANISPRDRESCAKLITEGLELQQEVLHFPWQVRDAVVVFYKLRAWAFMLGDKRSLGLLDLGIGSLNINMRSLQKSSQYHKAMLRGVDAVNALGDSDILLHASGMICFYNFMEGQFTKAIHCAYSAMYVPEQPSNLQFERMLYSYAAFSAISLGEYDVACNILRLAIGKAKSREKWMDVGSLRAILAHACLMRHQYDEAFVIIDDILGVKNLTVQTYAGVLATRSLAYYHYMRGQVRSSYVCFRNWLKSASERGMTHNNYIAAPYVLELMAAYHLAGLPPLGGAWEQELALCLASPSRQLRGVALRLAAEMRARECGGHDETALLQAQEALALFRVCSTPVEAAKALYVLTRLYQARGENDNADSAATEAWAIHEHYGQPPWPEDIDALRGKTAGTARPKASPLAALCVNLFQAVRQQYAWEENEAFFHSLLYAVLATFGAERGGVFLAEQESFRIVAEVAGASAPSCSLGSQAARTALLHETYKARRSQVRLLPSLTEGESSELLVLVADVEAQGVYFFCVEGQLGPRLAQMTGEEWFRVLENYLATEISVHLRRNNAWRDKMRSAVSSSAGTSRLGDVSPILFRTNSMRTLLGRVDHVAPRNATVLILGESGVGKELIAHRLHDLSGRSGQFVAVNLASTPVDLFESEFYGHEKGSFTGAHYQKRGLCELADKGTLFIDEAGDIPLSMQVKLLRVLQEKQFMRVGGTRSIHSDFRLIAATHRHLEDDVRAGHFREDLFYRLSVVPLHVPPLRERPEDVLYLADYFLRLFAERHNMSIRPFSDAEQRLLLAYPWPGNVRELKNYVERSTLLPEGERPLPSGQPFGQIIETRAPAIFPLEPSCRKDFSLPAGPGLPSLSTMQDLYFEHVYRQSGGTVGGKNGVATVLGISRTTAYAWIERLNLKVRFFRQMTERKAE